MTEQKRGAREPADSQRRGQQSEPSEHKERTVRIIPTISTLPKQHRTCAYVRVSTPHELQQNSYENQRSYYERHIRRNPAYIYAGVYGDAGISGGTEKRPGLDAMMEKARQGELDLILTKSISRLARNAELLLSLLRELKDLHVGVVFEEQRIDTRSATGELMITLLASYAQAERKSQSESIQWSIRNGYRHGRAGMDISRLLGYEKTPAGGFSICEEEAKTVRWIFEQYLGGRTICGIAQELSRYGKAWNDPRVGKILKNEKYCGDTLTQKSYIDALGRQKLNHGELDKYLIRGTHPEIIPREIWENVQTLLDENGRKTYPYTSRLKCGVCGASLIRYIGYQGKAWWKCYTYMSQGKGSCRGTTIAEWILDEWFGGQASTEEYVVEELSDGEYSGKKKSEDYRIHRANRED